MARWVVCAALICAGCGAGERDEPLPQLSTPPSEIAWPDGPEELAGPVGACVTDYRELGERGLPPQADGTSLRDWLHGPYNRWVDRYNATRERCDAVFHGLDQAGAPAQVLLATQSVMHERLASEAAALDEDPQMFVMATYWRLGAACTYQSCGQGPSSSWSSFCADRARSLPPCPPVEDEPSPGE